MSARNASEFLQIAQDSGLLTVAQADQLSRVMETAKIETVDDLASVLVEQQALTAYQIDLLRAGRGTECRLGERYQIEGKLGAGAMGEVYKARDLRLDRYVAIKILPPHSLDDADAVARFQREAKALAKLSHANIIQAHDVGEDHGRHFVVMEYVEGKNLLTILRERGPLPPARAADYICQAALGLHHAHEKGLVHRDLKPSNLLVTPERLVKIVDLGLARFFQDQISDPHLTREGMGMGTPDYMPPEQFRDARTADPRADIYSLGCTFYHLLSGEPPFPGSSLSEKCRAHEVRMPSFADKCPDVPGGLVEIVRRMMAKQPEQRFQTALDVALALEPHIADASASSVQIKATASWQGSRAPFKTPAVMPRRRMFVRLSLTIGAVCTLLIAGVYGPGRLRDPEHQFAAEPGQAQSTPPATAVNSTAPVTPAAKAVVTIENGLTVAKDGTGQYQTIREALANVRAGQTIRVLDDALYDEAVTISGQVNRAGITLEAVQGATIDADLQRQNLISIAGVPNVTLRGFRLRGRGQPLAILFVHGECPGLRLERLRIETASSAPHAGFEVIRCLLDDDDPPVVIADCEFRGLMQAISISACGNTPGDYSVPFPTARMSIHGNLIQDCFLGIAIRGDARQIQVTGNRFQGINMAALQLENLVGSPRQILLANNSIIESPCAVRVWDEAARGDEIEVVANLVVATTSHDFHWIDSGGSNSNPKGPGNGAAIQKAWKFSHNWREGEPPTASDDRMAWIPPSAADKQLPEIPLISRDAQSDDFLRPAADSPLAIAGAGEEDPSLPKYVGAVPPPGVEPWDWQQTWDRRLKFLFTVSQDPKAGGDYRTINEALAAARPNAVVRIVDQATYRESVQIVDAKQHRGLRLESAQGATLEASGDVACCLLIHDVTDVTVRDLRFNLQTGVGLANLVRVTGNCAGTVLEKLNLTLTIPRYSRGISLERLTHAKGANPVVVRNCRLTANTVTCDVAIFLDGATNPEPSGRMLICDNRIFGSLRAIHLEGGLAEVAVASNLVTGAAQEGIGAANMYASGHTIWLANNSLFNCTTGVRFWDDEPYEALQPEQVRVSNNLIAEATFCDVAIVRNPQGGATTESYVPGDLTAFVANWPMRRNWRDLVSTPIYSRFQIPLQPDDRRLTLPVFVSRTATSPDFMRPAPGSPFLEAGSWHEHPGLPPYVGAVPPAGIAAWDWRKAWDLLIATAPSNTATEADPPAATKP